MRTMLHILVALVIAGAASGQPTCAPGGTTPLGTYRCDPVPNAWASIAGLPGTVALAFTSSDDSAVALPFPAGFAFSFYGTPRTTINVCTNGFANFSALATTFTNRHVGDDATPNEGIFPWYDDLHLGPGTTPPGSVLRNFDLTAGAEKLTLQWSGVRNFPSTSTATFSFQAILYASTHTLLPNVIEFRYDRASGPGVPPCLSTLLATPSATVGVEPASPLPMAGAIDATERGAANASFPACDIRITPHLARPATPVTSTTVVAEPQYCTIVGLPGTVAIVPPSCTSGQPCTDNDDAAAVMGRGIPLPWKVNVHGRVVRHANMNSNGVLGLGQGNFNTLTGNVTLPAPAWEPDLMLAPFWDDLEGSGPGSGMFYSVHGRPGCRVMTFEWARMDRKTGTTGDCIGTGGNISFQVKIFEGSAGALFASSPPCPLNLVAPGTGNDRIEFHYDHAGFVPPPTPFTATIGWENANGTAGGVLAPSPSVAFPPVEPTGTPGKVVIQGGDCGLVRYYGDPTNNAVPPFPLCLPEIKTNCVAPVIGNTFGLQMIGASPGASAILALDFSGAIPGTKTPVPCGGNILPGIGTLWVNLGGSFLFPVGSTSPGGPCEGCARIDFPLPNNPVLIGFVLYAQWLAIVPVPIPPFGIGVELTEGAKITIG